MKRRLVALLLALVAVFGVAVSAPQPAAADGPVSNAIEGACRIGTGPILGTILHTGGRLSGIGGLTGSEMCDAVGDAGAKAVKEAWKEVWESILGDIIRSAQDVAKWILKKVLTFSLLGPSVDLAGTGLWGGKATLAGMLTWLGLLIAAAGVIWNLGKMALTGQAKYAGRAMAGWVENTLLSGLGVSLFAMLLVLGDALSAGLVDATFADDGKAYERISSVLLPNGISNPITMLCVVAVLLLIGFIQMIMIFLRQSAIPVICLLLPVAGGGRTGGETTRKWAPTLITTGMVIVAYKPIVAVIICTGFAEFGHSATLAEWLRGCATLILAVLAPGPLTKIFAPFGAAVGAGMSAGGASGALSAAAGYFAGKNTGGDSGSGGTGPTDAVSHARYLEQQMGSQGRAGNGGEGEDGGAGGDAQTQAARNEAAARVPGQAGAAGADAATTGASSAAANGTAAAGSAGTAAAPVGIGIQVLDGVNDAVQGASGQMGGGNQQ
ncbi:MULTISPECIES: hypothetical protein [Streptomyces]|uniref:hypothetical protein n=1 Tax=Streptomyces TaxID=1883 RepID=UPI00073DE4C7|nr:hypothetical protein [Streptomyces sp. FBKL.4005]OYP10230.1 hypothetical protein CFC35_41280 [Streptomyces sp. FBKL.4005]CUW33378.1 hypothetical protein TUE45_pSRTUE45a_0010 [Streptomyces reticuli]